MKSQVGKGYRYLRWTDFFPLKLRVLSKVSGSTFAFLEIELNKDEVKTQVPYTRVHETLEIAGKKINS